MAETPPPIDVTPDDFEVVAGGAGVPASVYERLYEAQLAYAFVLDGEGTVRALSGSAGALAGEGAGLGRALAKAAFWSEPDRVSKAVRRAARGMYDRFYTATTHDGATRTLLVNVQPIDGPDGQDWIAVEARDVTDLVASEHQLRDAHAQIEREQARLNAVLEASPVLICAVDAEGRLTDANGAWRRAATALFGTAPKVGEPYVDRSPYPELWRRALAGETVAERIRFQPEAATEWVDAVFAPVRSDQGRVLGAMVVERDVTGRVEATHLRQALSSAAVGTFTIGPAGELMAATPAFRQLFGLGPNDVTLDDVLARIHDSAAGTALQAVSSGSEPDLDLRVDVGGAPVRLRVRGVALDDGVWLTGVAYPEAKLEATGDDRWEDLVAHGGWGGRGVAGLVATGAPAEDPDPAALADRVDALRRTGLLDSAPSEAFDTLTRLVSRALGVPISLVSLVDADRQFFKSQVGLGGEVAEARETPLSHSFCQYVANERRPLVVRDAREAPLVADNGAVTDFDVVAYLGVPVAAPDGHVIGALCAIDTHPHDWTDDDVRLLSSVAEVVTAEVAAHQSSHDA